MSAGALVLLYAAIAWLFAFAGYVGVLAWRETRGGRG